MKNEDMGIFTELISCKDLILPKVEQIEDMRQFMSDPKNFNGDINELTDRLEAKTQQCRKVLKVLQDRLRLKKEAIQKVKEDVLELESEMKKPEGNIRFLTNHEKVKIRFLDETITWEHSVPEALERYSIKMSSLHSEIMALDSDVDSVTYLTGVSQVNVNYVKDWYKKETEDKEGKTSTESIGDGPQSA
ncbi:uncharacterized protein LOC108108974 [Drosophila eugracilis]|uniref:uncharacterized protein LOC108108974 n=1 Tax=Drosophila eugracilis TaxID=29029 RepID=UPI0007E7F26E|nr:uncharacterized protein LOC108108974 [Drosophila eugracilis]